MPYGFDSRPGHQLDFDVVIIFDLACTQGHRFECWFASAEDFDKQRHRGLVVCPHCDSKDVSRVPSVVHIGGGGSAEGRSKGPGQVTADHSLAVYHELVNSLIAHSEDTGSDFAKEARRIHYREAPVRAIHGSTSDSEFEALRDEGIEVWRLPVVRKEKLH